MKTEGGSTTAKRRAGRRAADEVADGDVVGLGTGSTTAYAIEAIGEVVADGLTVTGVPTSVQSRRLALEAGIELTSLDAVDRLDLAIDGADQVYDDPDVAAHGTLIKGGGAAHAREKVVAAAADRFVVVADPTKLTAPLERSVPLAVRPDAWTLVADRVGRLGGDAVLRDAECKDGPVVTDDGSLVLDADFGPIEEPATLAGDLAAIPGVRAHGLFVDMADVTYVGTDEGVESREY